MSETLAATAPPPSTLAARLADADLPEGLAEELLAQGAVIVPELVSILEADLALGDAKGDDYAPVHAAKLLGTLGDDRAIDPLLRTLVASDPLDDLHTYTTEALTAFGARVVEPALASLSAASTEDARDACLRVLAGAGVRDDRILAALVAGMPGYANMVVKLVEDYGDPAAVPLLSKALDGLEPDPGLDSWDTDPVVAVADVIVKLGGTLTPAQAEKVASVHRAREAARDKLRAIVRSEVRAVQGLEPSRRSSPEAKQKKRQRKLKKKAQRRNRR